MNITMIAGSNREGAASTYLLRYIASLLKENNSSVALVDLRELPLPLYSPDTGELHPNAQYVLEAVTAADGLILATPEYHGSVWVKSAVEKFVDLTRMLNTRRGSTVTESHSC